MVCTRCGSIFQQPRRHMSGNFLTEVFLWLLFIIPGLIYSVWRLTTKAKVCPSCGSKDIIPEHTPEGQRIASRVRL